MHMCICYFLLEEMVVMWKFCDLVSQEKDRKKSKNAACKTCADMLTYSGSI